MTVCTTLAKPKKKASLKAQLGQVPCLVLVFLTYRKVLRKGMAFHCADVGSNRTAKTGPAEPLRYISASVRST